MPTLLQAMSCHSRRQCPANTLAICIASAQAHVRDSQPCTLPGAQRIGLAMQAIGCNVQRLGSCTGMPCLASCNSMFAPLLHFPWCHLHAASAILADHPFHVMCPLTTQTHHARCRNLLLGAHRPHSHTCQEYGYRTIIITGHLPAAFATCAAWPLCRCLELELQAPHHRCHYFGVASSDRHLDPF